MRAISSRPWCFTSLHALPTWSQNLMLGYGSKVASTIILSEETARAIIEAHASMTAWHHAMANALRTAGSQAPTPNDEQLRAYVKQFGAQFPELGSLADAITDPRPYSPPPAVAATGNVVENEGVDIAPPPPPAQATPAAEAPPAPPPIVDPNKVKYE